MAKQLSEQIKVMQNDLKQKENLLKELLQKKKAKEQKERTHRLIERGAILESMLDSAVTLTNEQIKSFLEKTIQTEFSRKILRQFVEPIVTEAAEKPEIMRETPNEG